MALDIIGIVIASSHILTILLILIWFGQADIICTIACYVQNQGAGN
jgi:hypothetical protein